MTLFKVWLREPQQTDDEAIKLVVDESADISDILLKVPELLRVQHLKPSEIQAEFRDLVLSNRSTVCNVFEGSTEGTLVIRPRPGVAIVDKSVKTTKKTRSASNGSDRRIPNLPPPSPRNQITMRSPRVASGSMGRVGCTNSTSRERRGSSRVSTPNRGLTPTRISTPYRNTTTSGTVGVTPRSSQRKSYPDNGTGPRTVSARSLTPTRDFSTSSLSTHMKTIPSRFRQEADKIKVAAKRNTAEFVCDAFKPQWGKPLCATCNHSKQAHWVYQRRKNSQEKRTAHLVSNDSSGNEEFDACCRTPNDKTIVSLGKSNDLNHSIVDKLDSRGPNPSNDL